MDKFPELENRFKNLSECSSNLLKVINEAVNYSEGFKEIQQEIRKIKDLSSRFSDKMSKKEIEVAFAGLEKTGKSALVNAFIEDDVLPSAFERATYIVTEIKYGEQNTVVIEFYTEDEFIKAVLKPFLKAVNYPQRDFISSLDSISLKQFKDYFDNLSSTNKELYEKELNRTAKDIIEILEGKEEIKRYLGKSTQMFSKDQKSDYRQFITDKYVSRAVKKVTIYAKALENIKNVIVYDLPGFDSPTFIHSKYTEDKVKEVDAIIFVREARKPDITKPELDILDIIEDTGVKIKEKAFFFLNKIDDLNSIEEIEEVKNKFIQGAQGKGIFLTQDRVILGSSLAKLHELGFAEYKDKGFVKEKLSRLGLENGINSLHQRLEYYYNNERTDIFDKRANMLEKDLKDIKNKTREKIEELKTAFTIPIEQYDYIMDKIAEQWKKAIEKSSSEIKNKYSNNKLLSDKLRKEISVAIESPSQELINEIISELELASTTSEEKPEKFNQKLRERLSSKIEEQIKSKSNEILQEEISNIFDDILEKLAKATINTVSDIQKTSFKDEDIEKIKEGFKSEFSDHNAEDVKYNVRAVLLRFFGDILDVILRNPIGSTDRFNKFKEIEREIFSLYAFHPDFNPESPVKDNVIISYVLYGTNLYDYKKLRNELTSKFKATEKEIEDIINDLQKEKIPADFALKILQNKTYDNIQRYRNASISKWNDIVEQKDTTSTYYEMRAKNYEEVIQEVNRDINNLKDIYENVIVNALNPEKAVVNYTILFLRSLEHNKKDHIRSMLKKLQPILFRDLLSEQDRAFTMSSLYKQLSNSLDEMC